MWTKWLELKQPYWSLRWKALVTDAGRTKRKRPGDCGDATPPLISYICMREKEMSAVLNVNILTYKMLLCYFVPPWPPTDEGHLPLDTIFFFFFNSVVIFLLVLVVVVSFSDLHLSFCYKEIITATTQLGEIKGDHTNNSQNSTGHIIHSQ